MTNASVYGIIIKNYAQICIDDFAKGFDAR